MPQRRLLLVVTTLFFLVAARQRAVRHPSSWPLGTPPADTFSVSQPTEVTTEHLSLDLTVNFEQRILDGTATLDIENLTGTRTLVLDTYELNIRSVTLDGGVPAAWSYGTNTTHSRPLRITIEPTTDKVTIAYSTSQNAPGLYWNRAEQSYGRTQPYLYSLNEPVAARSWIPSQDTPTVRHTYDATLRVPRGLLALMGATNNATTANDLGVYTFRMNYRIPVYLVALAVGRLEFRALDERTGVYAEPELIDDAAWELQYLPEMVDVAEDIAGEFPFSRHDVLFMPPTFVVGGMEHPMLNFVDPGIITRNRPAEPFPSTLIAHELAHSWAGDSATLATWNDVWLNEGITSYLTHRIIEEMSGVERAEYGLYNDRRNYSGYAQSAPPDSTILHGHLADPGLGFGATSYIKGALFIRTLEDYIGREEFDRFLPRYFQTFRYRWVDDQNFVAYLRNQVLNASPGLEQQIRLGEWLYAPKLPSNVTAPATSAVVTRAQQRADRFKAGTPFAQLQPETWSPLDLDQFLARADAESLRARMSEIDAVLALSERTTPPLSWLLHAIHARYQPAMAGVERALMRGGPSSWVVPLYSALAAVDAPRAREIFSRARGRYRDDVARNIATIVGASSNAAIRKNAA